MRTKMRFLNALLCGAAAAALAQAGSGQSISPVIAEYRESASGSFVVTNDTGMAMAVVLEPKSFSIDEAGKGTFRDLDDGIHLEMSTNSLRLDARESATVFYKVSVEKAPEWLSIYAVFSPLHVGKGLNVKIMLPHTVYVYQKDELERSAIRVDDVAYNAAHHRVECLVTNQSERAGRAAAVGVEGEHASADGAGFPLLPHQPRRLSIEWTSEHPPRSIEIDFARFTVKAPVNATVETAAGRGIP